MAGSGGIEQEKKMTHGHGQKCGDFWGRAINGINGKGKTTIKN